MLYHKQTGFPIELRLPRVLSLTYSNHAKRAAENDRYGRILLSPFYDTAGSDLIEMETVGKLNPIKIVLRKVYTDKLDLVTVIALNNMVVKTVWLNRNTDKHGTLNLSNYTQINGVK